MDRLNMTASERARERKYDRIEKAYDQVLATEANQGRAITVTAQRTKIPRSTVYDALKRRGRI